MGLISIVRHGQASPFANNYDQLSDLGKEQGRLLGEYWASRGISWDRVLVGPRLRHRETEELVGATYRARGLPWPRAETVDGLDEIDMARVITHLAGKEYSRSKESMQLGGEVPEHERPQAIKAMFGRMLLVIRDFAAGRVTAPNVETWSEFKLRARNTLDLMAGSGKSKRVVAFSSGGFIGMLFSRALELNDERTVDLMMQVRNGSYSSLFYSPGRITMTSFNAVPHLSPEMWTLA